MTHHRVTDQAEWGALLLRVALVVQSLLGSGALAVRFSNRTTALA